MIVLYIFFIIIFFIFAILIFPTKVKIKYELNTNFDKKEEEDLNTLNSIDIYVLKCIKIASINEKNVQKVKKNKGTLGKIVFDIIYKLVLEVLNFQKMEDAFLTKKDFKKISKNIYFEKLHMNLGINLKNIFFNIYIISLINAIISLYLAINAENINFEDTSYFTFISNKIFNIKVESIITLKLVNTISIILKVIFKYRKVVKKDGTRTSNRKLNDDCYDFS